MRTLVGTFAVAALTGSLAGQETPAPKPIATGFGQGAYRLGDGVSTPLELTFAGFGDGGPPTTIDRDIEVEAVVREDGKVGDARLVRTFTTQRGAVDDQ